MMKRRELISAVYEAAIKVYDEREARSIAMEGAIFLPGQNKNDFIVEPSGETDKPNAEELDRFCERVVKGEPLQYIIGQSTFYGLPFKVLPGVLIPRPETEELVDWVVADNTHRSNGLKILDLGTGSGAIAIGLAKFLQGSHVTAVDISSDAIATALENVLTNGVEVDFIEDDILSLSSELGMDFDIIVSNPPYIPRREFSTMHDNVRKFEPSQALFVPNEDPLVFYRKIAEISEDLLTEGGLIYFEIHENFSEDIIEMLHSMNFTDIECRRDINDKPRMVKCRKK